MNLPKRFQKYKELIIEINSINGLFYNRFEEKMIKFVL